MNRHHHGRALPGAVLGLALGLLGMAPGASGQGVSAQGFFGRSPGFPDGGVGLGGRAFYGAGRADPLAPANVLAYAPGRSWAIPALRVGMTRAQFSALFELAGGAYSVGPGEGVYSYRACPNIKVRVTFDDPDVFSRRPTDRITQVSLPFWDQVAYD